MNRFSNFLFGLLCFAYVVWPIDVLPEAFLGPFGLPDDVVAFFYGIQKFKQALKGE